MNRRKLLLAGAVLTLGLVAGLLAFLHTGRPALISFDQLGLIDRGMSAAEVERVLGRPGTDANLPYPGTEDVRCQLWAGEGFILWVGFNADGAVEVTSWLPYPPPSFWDRVRYKLSRLLP